MTIVFDQHIPFLSEAFRTYWPDVHICPMEPEQIDASAVRKADVLVVRTRTKVNEQLLADSSVQLVCTATIGYDHIDTAYCEAKGIRWISCPGCNAQAVCDYIEEAIDESFSAKRSFIFEQSGLLSLSVSGLCIGIVGVGHVGSLVAKMAERKGIKVLLNDPPKGIGFYLDESEGIEPFSGGKIAECDIITFHVPLRLSTLTSQTSNSTYHLCDEAFLAKCKPGALIINAARGGVVDEEALLKSGHPYILDTWENEPAINSAVLAKAERASMHIAGYSVEGKRNASQRCLDAISEQFGLPRINIAQFRYTDPSGQMGDTSPGWLSRITEMLKANPDSFEALRKTYPLR